MQITSTTDTERNLAVELVLEDIPGGGTVADADFPTSSSGMEAGAYVGIASGGEYHVTKIARSVAALNATGFSSDALCAMIYNNHEFKVGDWIQNTANTASGTHIVSLTASGTGITCMTIASGLNIFMAASGLFIQAATGGERANGFLHSPVAVSSNSFDLSDTNTGVGLLVRGRVRKSAMPYATDSTLEALLPLIRFV